MTREEAKGIIYNEVLEATAMLATRENTEEETKCLERFIEASNMAIEALSQPERPKGQWEVIGKTENGANILQCSNCKRIRRGSVKSAFCRDCGAEMER